MTYEDLVFIRCYLKIGLNQGQIFDHTAHSPFLVQSKTFFQSIICLFALKWKKTHDIKECKKQLQTNQHKTILHNCYISSM